MWVDFHFITPVPYVSFADARADGTHTDWSAPQPLPQPPHTPQGATFLLPHVAPDGTIYTTITNFPPNQGVASVFVDKSGDGGTTWSVAGTSSTVRNWPRSGTTSGSARTPTTRS